MLKILNERPPNWNDICAVFDVERHKPIFAWGFFAYNPFGHQLELMPELIAHEEMHGLRQNCGPGAGMAAGTEQNERRIRLWWADYLASPSFRLEEEIPAHRAEYRQLLRIHGNDRPNRRRWLRHVADRLRNPLYGYNHLVTGKQAKRFIELDETEAKG